MRYPARKNRPRTAQPVPFPAPTGGWVSNLNLSTAGRAPGAFVLRNWFPGTETVKLRRGSEKYATIGSTDEPVRTLMTYVLGSSEHFFAAAASGIYDISTVADPDVSPTPLTTGPSDGTWSWVQFSTTGGAYLIAVNGQDSLQLYDGTRWWRINNQPIVQVNYDAEVSPFTVGATVTGGTSGATGVVERVVDNGMTGNLAIRLASGTFQDNEAITGGGGSATVNGAPLTLFGAITGVATSNLIAVWVYKRTLFFAEKNSLTAWYLPVDSITGTAVSFPLGGEFGLGGSLLFGSSWSMSTAGQGGLSDQCIFASSEGEVVVYQGTSPSTAATWSRVSLYRVGKPLGSRAYMRVGGDVLIASDIGLVALSVAAQRDLAALAPAALSYNIEPDWAEAAQYRLGAWQCALWSEGHMLIVAPEPEATLEPLWFVANALSGAWCEFTGLSAYSLVSSRGRLFFGSSGRVVEINATGYDEGTAYVGSIVGLFDSLNAPASRKLPRLIRATLRSPFGASAEVVVNFDFDGTPPAAGAGIVPSTGGAGVWGVSDWGGAQWSQGASQLIVTAEWVSAGGSGYYIAPAMSVTSGSIAPSDVELIGFDVMVDSTEVVG